MSYDKKSIPNYAKDDDCVIFGDLNELLPNIYGELKKLDNVK
jgi:hypothetical protein